ncbi:hypothetical protein GCM10007036_16550 [Alsobacter metallidurans]|uniref:Uncharacterized protein n=1 Tax=Alsobacter metallidurans TaxID=340221 RepID=A0A917MH79_9HYPH|nr:hypothetical protein [Alsobacter metallidurans]GGH16121.1 hypothetical protein GCM10007036_16550 [Alsobacter metallidurans]
MNIASETEFFFRITSMLAHAVRANDIDCVSECLDELEVMSMFTSCQSLKVRAKRALETYGNNAPRKNPILATNGTEILQFCSLAKATRQE